MSAVTLYREIDALGGVSSGSSWDDGYNHALTNVLNILGRRGFSEAADAIDATVPTEANPPAFPRDHRHNGHNGMNLRDWFAGQIANGMAANSGTMGSPFGPGDIAKRSYECADAMLAARQTGEAPC